MSCARRILFFGDRIDLHRALSLETWSAETEHSSSGARDSIVLHSDRGGMYLFQESANDNKLGGRWPTMLDLVQLCITDDGRNHTVSETRSWMEEAGYSDIKFSAMNLLNTNGYLRGYHKSKP